ncbi:Ig-like domain-containing protein [Flavobacterium sp. GNP001]
MKKTILLIFLLLFAINGNSQCWKVISAGTRNTVGIKQDGTLWAWGDGLLTGAGDVTSPVQIGTATNWKTVSAGYTHALAIKTDGTLWAWGLSSDGSFGSGIAGDFSILPKQIGMQSDWLTIAAGTKVSTAIKTDGTLWSWGYNAVGQVGDGTTVTKLIPTQIGTDTNWSSIALHSSNYTISSTLALKTDGTLWAWGTNNDGQLGDGTFVQKNAPVQIGTDTNWSSIDTGESHSLAIKTNGTLWAWGKNQYGELGDGTTVLKNVPTQIGTSTLWTSIRGGSGFSVGTQTGGLLLAWGVNSSGQLGNGTLTIQTTPLLSTTSAQTVSVGSSHSFIQNATGTYSWGYNAYGVLGDGTTANKNIPTLINCPTSRPQAMTQTYCSSATVANLVATGTALQWYATSTIGTALAGTTPLATGTYYVSQTENGIESLRTAVAVTVSTTPPPTAPTSAAQTFCSGATIANLTATGTTLQWYTSLVEKTALTTTTALATGTYYVSESLNGCESARTAVSVTVNTTLVPTVAAQAFCVSGTVANLVATGTDLKWYANPTGGTVLAGTTVLATGTYYVSQTLNGCESARTAVAVTINTTPAPTVAAQTFCNSGTIASLTFTETIGATIQWYATSRSTTPLVATTALSTGTYYVSQTISGCESARIEVSVTINTTPVPTAAAQSFCSGVTVANLTATGTDLKWYANATGGSALATTSALTSGTYYVTQTLNGCESARVSVAVTNISPAPMAAAQAFCNTGTVADLNATGTIIKWYANPSSTVALLGTTALATGTYYVTQTLNGCESARTAVIVTVNSTTAPIVSAQAFCHAATVANLAATGTAIKWYATATGGSTLVATTALTSGTYYVTQTLNGCESTRVSVAVTITSTTAPIVSAQAFCNAATVANLIATGTAIKWYANGMGGSPLVATTVLATGTYYVSQSLNGCESGRSSVAVTINTTSAPMAAAQVFCNAATVANLVATGTTIKWYANPSSTSVLVGNTALATGTYYVTQTLNGCESARTAVAITINITAPPIIAAQTFCGYGSIASITVPETFPETTLAWYATASGGVALLANTTLNTGTYYATATTNGCESTRTAVSIIVNNTPVPLANAQTLCSTATVANLVASGTNLRWYATTTGTSLAGTTLLTTGTYYVSQTVNICESPKTAVAVTITSNPSISYGTPNTYSVGTSISPLIPVNTGCPIPTSEVSTFAGSGAIGATDGTSASASFYRPSGVTVDATGNIYVVDTYNQKIRKITPAGVVSTFAGNGSAGATDGPAATASFYAPSGITIDAAGNIYVADIGSRKIRKITPAGIVSTIAGSGLAGSNDGLAANASFYGCSGVTVDASGNIYVADSFNNKIRKITPAGVVSTFAGNGSAGDTDGPAATASFSDPSGVTIDTAGIIYVADSGNNKIRKITPAGVVSTVAGSGVRGYTNGPAATAGFYLPSGVALDAAGNIYVADHYNQIIRKITSAGIVSTVAGINGVFGSTDGSLAIASFDFPNGVALDSSGYIYVADRQNNKIRKITLTSYEISPNLPAGLSFDSTTGIISGAPTATSPATNYVITAHTMGGTISTAVNISVGTLSTDSFEVKNNLKIYPNPATGNVTIELNNLNNAKLQVSDINGRILLNQKLDNTTVIDVSGFPSATYLFKVNSDQGTATSKVIKK